jgi:4-amino-4-deoxy-L-arabinose transferase-like glycosyltransferase
LLTNLLTVWFFLFTDSDGAARVPAALAGWLLGLTPLLFRPRVGWLATGGACLALLFSPIGLLASRTVDPASLVLLLAAVSVGCLLRAWDESDGRWLLAVGVAVGLGLGTGGAFVGQVAAVALAAATWPPFGRPTFRLWWWLPRAIVLGLATLLLSHTLLLTRPAGLQAGLIAPFADWLRALSFGSYSTVVLFWLHEIPLLLLAAAGLWSAHRSSFARFLAVWALASFLLAGLQPSPSLATLAGPLTPLALLAGLGLRGLRGLRGVAKLAQLPVCLAALALLVPIVFWLFAMNVGLGRGTTVPGAASLVALGGLLAIALFASSWLSRPQLQAALLLLMIVAILALQLAMVSRLVYAGHQRGGPVMLGSAARPELRQVEARVLDWWRQNPTAPVLVDVGLRPALGWYLRNGPPVRYVEAAPASPERALLGQLTAATRPPGQWTRLVAGERYQPAEQRLAPAALWRWLVHRQPIGRAEPYAIFVSP